MGIMFICGLTVMMNPVSLPEISSIDRVVASRKNTRISETGNPHRISRFTAEMKQAYIIGSPRKGSLGQKDALKIEFFLKDGSRQCYNLYRKGRGWILEQPDQGTFYTHNKLEALLNYKE